MYTLQLSANDDALTGTDNIALTVNNSPVTNAGPDQTITLPSGVTLNGSATDDGIPNPPGILTYTWSKISGPGTVSFKNVHAPSTTATFSTFGTYTLQLAASDSVFVGKDRAVISVNPAATPTPTPTLTPTPTPTPTPEPTPSPSLSPSATDAPSPALASDHF
jgi:hypothetical protein